MMERIYDRLRAMPGATSVAGISFPPLNSLLLPTAPVVVEGRGAESLSATYFLVTPNLFATLRAPLVRGRDFDARDIASAPWGAIVNETAARRFWPGQDPVGQRVTLDIVPEEQPRTVIGVVPDIPLYRTQQQAEPVIYASYLQQPSRSRGPYGGMFGQMTFVMRPDGQAGRAGIDLASLVRETRRAVAEIDPNRPIADIAVLDEQLASGMRGRRSYALWLGLFAAVATALAAIGIYGVVAFGVAQRVREIGIRRALGADAREIVALVAAHALRLIAIGLVLGIAGAWWLTRLIATQLWAVTPTDPVTFAAVSLLLVSVALLASFVPMRRALRVDPTIALKYE
jgi:putative ABC transport system permease protein